MKQPLDSQAPPPAAPGGPLAPPDFEPVRLRYRRDGWTRERQRAFIAALFERKCVLEACRRVGKSPEAAYRLYRHPAASSFRSAWDRAVRKLPWPAPDPARTASTSSSPPSPSSTSGAQWQLSCLSSSSTSAPSTSGYAPPPAARPAYSLEAFVRAAQRGRRGPRE